MIIKDNCSCGSKLDIAGGEMASYKAWLDSHAHCRNPPTGPMGASQWLEHGKKYGYYDFFLKKFWEKAEKLYAKLDDFDHVKSVIEKE